MGKEGFHFKNGTLLLYEDGRFRTEKGDLWTIGNRIRSIKTAPDPAGFTEVDAAGKLLMPGLINLHTHAYMSFLRNYADDVPFAEWLFRRVMPVEDSLDPDCAYYTSLLGIMEMLRTGTTCFMDMHMYPGRPARAAQEAGIRAYFGRGLVGEELDTRTDRRFLEALSEKEEWESDRIRFTIAPHAIYSCSPSFYRAAAQEGRKRGMLLQTHLSESETEVSDCLKKYGKTPVALLEEAGFLGPDCMAAHCVKLQEDDFEILARTRTNVVTNPASNAKLGNGAAPLSRMRRAGISLCIGTDGAASNNTLNLFREMSFCTLLHKALEADPEAIPAQFAISACTVNPARALGRQEELGILKEGALADLVLVDLKEVSLFPANNIVSSLCYSASGHEVDSVMVDGAFVMRNRSYVSIDAERVYWEVGKILKNL